MCSSDLLFLDQMLPLLQRTLSQLSIPDVSGSFSRSVLGVSFRESLTLSNGTVAGLDSISRVGRANVSRTVNGDLTMESKLGVTNASVKYDVRAVAVGYGPTATVVGQLSSVEILMRFKSTLSDSRLN